MTNRTIEDKYIQQVNKLTIGLKHATQVEDIALISKYESMITTLLKNLQGKDRPIGLSEALETLKVQHQHSRSRVSEMLEEVKKELSQFKKKKKRMVAYTPVPSTHFKINA